MATVVSISNSSCVSDGYSDTIYITVNPNPPIQIVSDCVTNGGVQQVHLSLTTPGVSSQANGNMVYHWSTGETTQISLLIMELEQFMFMFII